MTQDPQPLPLPDIDQVIAESRASGPTYHDGNGFLDDQSGASGGNKNEAVLLLRQIRDILLRMESSSGEVAVNLG